MEKSGKKSFSGGSKDKQEQEIVRSGRISRCPSEWWLVKPEEGKYFYLDYLCLKGPTIIFSGVICDYSHSIGICYKDKVKMVYQQKYCQLGSIKLHSVLWTNISKIRSPCT